MPYTTNLNLVKPEKTDQYNVKNFNDNMQKIDDFAGLTPPKALTANKLTSAKNINGVAFDGLKSIITGLGLYSETETYNENNIAYKFDDDYKISVKRSKIGNNVGNNFDDEEFWEDVPMGSGSSSGASNPFDIKIFDHILEGDEAVGWAPLGTYVYKNLAPALYAYPDFYNLCLEEMANATPLPVDTPWKQPILTENGTLGGDSFAVAASSQYGDNWAPYKALDGDTSTSWQDNGTSTNAYFTFYNPIPIKVTQITWSGTPQFGTITEGNVFGSNDNETWQQVGTLADLSDNAEYFKYYKITATNWTDKTGAHTNGWAELQITAVEQNYTILYQNSNRHVFYDIKNKSFADEIYQKTGVAWYFGIDEENERIFLPRNDYISYITGTTVPITGNGMNLGITNGTNTYYLISHDGSISGGYKCLALGASLTSVGSVSNYTAFGNNIAVGIDTDPTKSGIEGNLSTLYQNSPYHAYICVGSTKELTHLTTTIPDSEVLQQIAKNKGDILNKVDKSSYIIYETDWFDITTSQMYSFDLSDEPILNVPLVNRSVQLIGLVKTAQNGFQIGDIIYPDYANYDGAAGNMEIGFSVWYRDNVVNLSSGNGNYLVNAAPSSSYGGISKNNVQVKIIIRGWNIND